MEMIQETVDSVKFAFKRPRRLISPILNLVSVILTSLILWRGIVLLTGLANPVVVIISGSMEPTMYRGDVLLLESPVHYKSGDVVVFHVTGRDIPIVHRIMNAHTDVNVPEADYHDWVAARHRERSAEKSRLMRLFDNDRDYYLREEKLWALTKGDNNAINDRGLYSNNDMWLNSYDMSGIATAYLPYVGMFTIWLHEYALLKYVLFGLMAFCLLSGYE